MTEMQQKFHYKELEYNNHTFIPVEYETKICMFLPMGEKSFRPFSVTQIVDDRATLLSSSRKEYSIYLPYFIRSHRFSFAIIKERFLLRCTEQEWNALTNVQKIIYIFYISSEIKMHLNRDQTQFSKDVSKKAKKLINVEHNKIIVAMLMFLLQDDNGDCSHTMRLAHEALLKSIPCDYQTDEDTFTLLKTIFPTCTQTAYCNTYFCDPNFMFKSGRYICERIEYYQPNPPCLKQPIHQHYYDDFTLPHTEQVKSKQQKPDIRDFLININFSIEYVLQHKRFTDYDNFAYPYKLCAYLNRLPSIKEYLVCRAPGCGHRLVPDFERQSESQVYQITYFACDLYNETTNPFHDHGVYINHCYCCRKDTREIFVIDSRECKQQERDVKPNASFLNPGSQGMYLCMRCGGTISSRIKPGTYCPNCGKPLSGPRVPSQVVFCPSCKHNGNLYGKHPVSNK